MTDIFQRLREWADQDVDETARDGTLEPNDIRVWAQMMREAADQGDALRAALKECAETEAEYRKAHDLYGDGDMRAGRAWDRMRRSGDAARKLLGESDGD